jgi:predicted phage terminase large subunit-like protein
MRRSLYLFAKEAWHVIDPAHPFVDNWHVGAVCDHLQAVFENKIKRLIIGIPPGMAKSQLACVLFPGWGWAVKPSWRSMYGSYSGKLAGRDHDKTRTLVTSSWYRDHFEPDWKITKDTSDTFENSVMGGRQAMTVGGGAAGFRGDCAVVDDPLNTTKRASAAEKFAASDWWFTGMSTRFNDQENQQRIIIMQRIVEDDLTGEALERGGYEHLCLPMHYDPRRRAKTFIYINNEKLPFWEDPRTEKEELLFPQKFPESVCEQLKKDLEGNASGQLEQDPVPDTGIKFKSDMWRFYRRKGTRPLEGSTAIAEPEKFDEIVASIDATFKGASDQRSKEAVNRLDFVVNQVWGRKGSWKFLLYQERRKYTILETIASIKRVKQMFPQIYTIRIEEKANGAAIVSMLQGKFPGIEAFDPGRSSKESRADAVLPQFRAGEIFVPEGSVIGRGETWVEEDLFPEFKKFPKGKHDDQVDACTQALLPWMEMHNSLEALYGASLE